jgi:type I restriction enzyme S subunit
MQETKVLHKKKVLAPKFRFKGFEGNWINISYGDIYSFYTTNSFSRDNLNYESGEIKNIHYGDIHTKFATLFDISKENVPYINSDINVSKLKDENFCQEKDLVIADASEDYADIGKTIELVNLNNEKIVAGLHTLLARPNKKEMAKGFAGYLVQTWNFRKQVMTIAQGTKVLSLSTSRLAALKLNIPSLPEQQKIASFLSAVDEKIQLLNKKKQLLEQYKKGVMQQLFSGKLRFKDENGKVYPKWEEKKFGDVAEKKSSNIAANAIAENTGEYKIYGATGFLKTVDFYKEEEPYISIVKDGAGVGRTLLCDAKTSVLGTLDIIKPIPNVDLYFLYSVLNNIDFVKYTKGSTIPHIYFKDYSTENINIPCLEEQKKIADFLSAIDVKIESLSNQINQTQNFKKGLLQQMFV